MTIQPCRDRSRVDPFRSAAGAYAVIAEPMDPDVDQVRLEARAGVAQAFAELIENGVTAEEFPAQDARIRGAAIVGAFLEAVVASLAERVAGPPNRAAVSAEGPASASKRSPAPRSPRMRGARRSAAPQLSRAAVSEASPFLPRGAGYGRSHHE